MTRSPNSLLRNLAHTAALGLLGAALTGEVNSAVAGDPVRESVRASFGTSGAGMYRKLERELVAFNESNSASAKAEFDPTTKEIHIQDPSKKLTLRSLQDINWSGVDRYGYKLIFKEGEGGNFIGHFQPTSTGKEPPGVSIRPHPFYKGVSHLAHEHKVSFLEKFDPQKVNTKEQTDRQELIGQLKPLDASLPFDAEQILTAPDLTLGKSSIDATNANSDLGVQYTLSQVLRGTVITKMEKGLEEPMCVLVSHGHAIAGIAELAKFFRVNASGKEEYLFDTTVYMPAGGWKDSSRMNVASHGAQLWGDEIERQKSEHITRGRTSAGGIAIALNGHRGDVDHTLPKGGSANISMEKMLGKPVEFAKVLKNRGLSGVVVVTEHLVDDPSKPNILNIDELIDSETLTFDKANKDMYDYLIALQKLGVTVTVVSGEQRVKLGNQ